MDTHLVKFRFFFLIVLCAAPLAYAQVDPLLTRQPGEEVHIFLNPDWPRDHWRSYLPFFEYTLKNVDKSGEYIYLQNGSSWKFSWFWQWTTNKWASGDRLIFSYERSNIFLPKVRVYNRSRDTVAWGEFCNVPLFDTGETEWIAQIQDCTLLVLNTGMVIDTKGNELIEFFNWQEGDSVLLLASPDDDERFDVWNFPRNSIIADLALGRIAFQLETVRGG